jgi:hypothetical protein
MRTKELRSKIFRCLKEQSGTLDELQVKIGKRVTKKDLSICLDALIKEEWVERYGKLYRLKYVLDAPLPQTPVKDRDWVYEKIQEVQGVVSRPVSYFNQYVDWIPQCDQGDRGTCCGYAGRYLAWLLQLKLIDPKPNQSEVGLISYDVPIKVFNQCTMLVDTLHQLAPSAEGLYDESRRIENIQAPVGSFIRGIVRAMKDYGYNYEKDRQTSKTSRCAPVYYPLQGDETETKAFLEGQASNHKIDGYATITTWEGLKDAIFNYGCAIIAVNLYDNMENNGKTGVLPDPKGNPIGSHALCAFGYDENYVYFLHSWRSGWSKVSGISKAYYNYACGTAYAPIDSFDVAEAEKLYGTVKVITNVPCTIYIGPDKYLMTKEAKSSWELDKICAVSAEPTSTMYQPTIQSKTVMPDKVVKDIVVNFTFEYKPTVKEDLLVKIRELIQRILDFWKNRG